MDSTRVWNLVSDPAWRPLTHADVPGYILLAICAAVLVGLTLWTYLGSSQTTPRRLFLLISLRLLALALAILTALRPSISVTDQPKLKSTLVLVLDTSESMSVTDEYDKLSRWEVMRRNVEKCEPLLKELQDDQDVAVHVYTFSNDFRSANEQYKPGENGSLNDWLKSRKPVGKRTDFSAMLYELHRKYQSDPNTFRGMLVLSDGGNNVVGDQIDPVRQALSWRGVNHPIYTFMAGRTDTKPDQKDVGFTQVAVQPAQVPVKTDMAIRATMKASGLENSRVRVKATVNKYNPENKRWEELSELTRFEEFTLLKPTGNEIEIVTKAPDKPGQVRVTLEIIDGPAEDRLQSNNRISTFAQITKEGVRILVIDQQRVELKFLRYALAAAPFDYVEMIRQTAEPLAGGNSFDVLGEAYDVIILGDVSPDRLNAIDPRLMEKIAQLVTERGVGLLMTGGLDTFGGTPNVSKTSWKGTPIAELLPVDLPPATAQVDTSAQIVVMPNAFSEFIMKLDPDSAKNRKLWERLADKPATRLGGYTFIGTPKRGSRVYAMARQVETGQEAPLLVGQSIGRGNGRVLAFGADQTWKWANLGSEEGAEDPDEGMKLHSRFWRQVALWLAHQDEVEGNVYVRPAKSRLAVNDRNEIEMGLRDKRGNDVPNPKLRYQVIPASGDPDETKAKPPERAGKGNYEARQPGEYRVIVWGEGKDPEGNEIMGDAEAWFDVYPDVSDELIDPSAKDSFLLSLENAARGAAPDIVRKADQLPGFIKEEFVDKPLKQTNLRPKLHPDWRRDGENKWFLPLVLVAFVAVLSLEWGFRRVWGMV